MSRDSDRDTLIDLFSTRGRGTQADTLDETAPASGTSTSVAAGRAARRNTRASGTRASLSPIANAILREARRELGSEDDMSISGDREIGEEQIAKAVDKVCQNRGHQIDDVERAEIIVHLKRDLLGWGVL